MKRSTRSIVLALIVLALVAGTVFSLHFGLDAERAERRVEAALTTVIATVDQELALANRTAERAQPIAERFGGDVLRLDEVGERLPEYDVVVSCTASTTGVFSRAIRSIVE